MKSFNLRKTLLVGAVVLVIGVMFYFGDLRRNPPGFFIDESSIAYNAHLIARTGHDEHGESWPLFFRAFGEFKNPVHVYLLAAVFRLIGPGIFSARCLSAAVGLVTVTLLGFLCWRVSGNGRASLLFTILALLTPWLFELSRLVMEVAIYPLVLVLFLLSLWRASSKPRWTLLEICLLAFTLALLTYAYSIGRLLAPLLALGLGLFATRTRLLSILLTWIAYALTLLPLMVFQTSHPGSLTGRFQTISYVGQAVTSKVIGNFARHYLGNLNPWRLFVTESSKISEIVHIPGPPALLTITALLIVASVIVLIRDREFNSWWRYVVYGLVVSVIPASLTNEYFHMLRLAPLAVFLLVLTIPACKWLVTSSSKWKQAALFATLLLIGSQGLLFQWQYHAGANSPRRLHTFDADYPAKLLPAALANAGSQPVYLADNPARPGYIQAFWYGTLQGVPLEKFVSLGADKSAPEGAVVITTESTCPRCQVLAESEPYTTYVATGQPRSLTQLANDGMLAEVSLANPLTRLRAGEQSTLQVSVRNLSQSVWLIPERSGSPFQLFVGNHWLDRDGKVVVNDDGRGSLPDDVQPGESISLSLTINAPQRAGEYVLEIDLLQEGVTWFGLRGSHTWRGPVTVVE